MEQEIKGRGVTRACSKCGTILASQIKGFGWFSEHIFCPNAACNSEEIIYIGYKTTVTVISALILILLVTGSFSFYKKTTAKKMITCDAFQTYEEAKNFYDTDKIKYSYLDKNNNGRPCEDLMI